MLLASRSSSAYRSPATRWAASSAATVGSGIVVVAMLVSRIGVECPDDFLEIAREALSCGPALRERATAPTTATPTPEISIASCAFDGGAAHAEQLPAQDAERRRRPLE